ncbi:DUF1430 domain-containing protein [Lysinibacillus sp. Y5S-8]|uniref:DUF1430 domain-containing protein n=1 Tax=Lysinibacillus sp. Y5S-8 TaxID=3122488 RepID=UPI00114F771A
MKKAKYILSLILFSIVLTFIGETYAWHLISFETKYDYVTMYKNKEVSQEDMLKDVKKVAEEEHLEVFVVNREILNIFSENIKIYGTEGTANYLEVNSFVQSGDYQSIFLGDFNFEVLPLTNITDINKFEKYYLIGDKENKVRFKQKLVDKYGGRFPQEGYIALNGVLNISVVWSIIICLLLLLTLYEVAQMRKEVVIRIISGERLQNIIFKNMISDSLFYTCAFSLLVILFLQFANVKYYLSLSILIITIFIIINNLIYFTLYIGDYKKDMKSKISVKRVLKLSYLYKIFTIFITVTLAAGCLTLIDEGIKFYKQKSFFDDAKDYSYVELNLENLDDTKKLRFDFYKEYLSMNNAISLVDLSSWSLNSDLNYTFADSGSLEYLNEKVSGLDISSLKNKVYFLAPEKYNSEKIISEMKEVWDSYYPYQYEYDIIWYNEELNIISIDKTSNINSKIVNNPIILLNNMVSDSINPYWNDYIFSTSMYKIIDTDWKAFIKNSNLNNEVVYKTNVYEHYLYQWDFYKKGILIGIVLLIILFILEAIIIKTILNYEYSINSVEIAIKKVMGYSLFERYKRLFVTTILFGFLAGISTLIIGHYLDLNSEIYLIVGALSVIVIEICFVFLYIRLTESRSIQSVLKGGIVK